MDNAIHRIHLYPLNSAIGSPYTYPLDSDLSGEWRYPSFEQPRLDKLYPAESAISFPNTYPQWIVIDPMESAFHRLSNRVL